MYIGGVPNNFKSDDSFLKKLAVGAAGTVATIEKLKALGFYPIELERGSTGYKIWKKIKIKRIRVPDILCLGTGLRVESRGKTKLEISMSHSLKDEKRAWDAGLRDDDFVSIVLLRQEDDSFINPEAISPVHFIAVSDMRLAFKNRHVSITTPKGFEEGSEIRVVWGCSAARQDSVVLEITDERIALAPNSGGRKQYVRLKRKGGIRFLPQVKLKESVTTNQIVASVVPVRTSLCPPDPVDESYYIEKLNSVNLSERYAAAKALRFTGYSQAEPVLVERIGDPDEDTYVKLEAAAALAAHGHENGWKVIDNNLSKGALDVPLETQLETVIITSEIPGERSEGILVSVLQDSKKHDELRAGAAWALGQHSTESSATALIDTFNAAALEIRIEAARALLNIGDSHIAYLVDQLKNVDSSKRDGVAWVLSKLGNFDPASIARSEDENLRKWLSYIVGFGKSKFDSGNLKALMDADSQVYFASSVLWQILDSWVNDLREF